MKQLLVLSGKGGTGKTTVASAFIKLSNARVYADCDVDAPNLHLVTEKYTESLQNDFYGMPKAYINRNLCTKCGKCANICRFSAIKNFMVDPLSCEGCGVCEKLCSAISMQPYVSGNLLLCTNTEKLFSTAELKMGSGNSGKLVTEVKKQIKNSNTDIAIIDGSPGIGCPVIASMNDVNLVLIVTEPTLSGISDMERIINTAKMLQIQMVVCVNKYDINIDNTLLIEKFCSDNDIFFAGKIPFDKNAIKAVNLGLTIADIDCAAGEAIKCIYEKTIKLI